MYSELYFDEISEEELLNWNAIADSQREYMEMKAMYEDNELET